MGWFTMKTRAQLNDEDRRERSRREAAKHSTSPTNFFDKQIEAIQAQKAKYDAFSHDIGQFFLNAGLGRYLSDEFNITTKYEVGEDNIRKLGVKWNAIVDDLSVEFGFVFIESAVDESIRIDWVAKILPSVFGGGRHMEQTGEGEETSARALWHDDLQSWRKYADYDTWKASTDGMPMWFAPLLREHIRPRR